MKKLFIISLIILSLASCENMMDVHKKFTDGGEIVYAPRLDSMKFYAGHNRVFFKFRTLNATNLKAVELYWDDEQLIVPVTMSSGYDSMLIEVPCKEEKSYTFKIRTTDEFGNHSLWETGFANSYGEMFIQSLVNRSIKSFSVSDNNGAITWYPPTSNLVRSEVRYTNTAQQETVISVPSAQMTTQCVGQTSNRFDVRSFFLPEADALDTFAVTWESVRPLYQVPRSKWSIKYCNSWHGMPSLTGTANMPHFIIDGDFTSFWHSSYANYAVGTHPLDPTITRDPPPFTIIIDFGEDIAIEQVDLYRRLNNNNTQLVIAYVPNIDPLLLTEADFKWLGPVSVSFSNHSIFKNYFYSGVANNNWQEVGRVEYPSDSNFDTPEKNQRIINPPTPVVARYLKLILPNTRSNGNVSLAEVFVSGR